MPEQMEQMPLSVFELVDWLDKYFPLRQPMSDEWTTEEGRLRYAQYTGMRNLIATIKANAEAIRRNTE